MLTAFLSRFTRLIYLNSKHINGLQTFVAWLRLAQLERDETYAGWQTEKNADEWAMTVERLCSWAGMKKKQDNPLEF